MEIRGLISKIDAIQAEAAYQSPTGHNPAGYDEPYSFAHDNTSKKPADTNVNNDKVNEIIQQLNNVMQKMQDTVALKSIKESSGIAYQLIESFGYTLEAAAPAASPSALSTVGSGLGRTLGRALPGVGAYLGFSDAYERAKAGDWSGAGLAGLSGALSLVPGVGWIPATIPQLGLMAKDYFSGSDEEPKDTTQSAKPVDPKLADTIKNKSNKDPSVNQLIHRSQEKIPSTPDQSTGQNQKTVKDPQKFEKLKAQLGITTAGDKITPEIQEKIKAFQQQKSLTVDGLPGPQTYAAAGISESLSDQLRNLLNILSEQEITSNNQEPMIFDKNGKKYVLLPDGRLIDEEGYLIDGNKSDLPRISNQPIPDPNTGKNLNEGWVGDLIKYAQTGIKNVSRGFKAGRDPANAGQYNPRVNAPGQPGHGTRFASPNISRGHKTGKFVGQHPKSIAAGAAAAATAGALGYDAMTSSNAPQTQVAKPTTQTPTTQTAPASQSKSQASAAKSSAGQGKSKIDRELQAIADEAKVLINTASKYPDATVKNAIEKLDTYLSTIPNIKWTAASWL